MSCVWLVFIFFFKQKTAYEMRISDWSSDVCSSDLLVSDPRVKALSFTGSTGVGRKLAIDAATSSTRLQLEMGGKNPLVVLDDADLNRAVAVALDGAFFGSGQRCTASSRPVVTARIHDRFVALLGQQVRSLQVGPAPLGTAHRSTPDPNPPPL